MTRRIALICLLLAACASPAFAQYGQSQIAWTDCGAAGTTARSFACNTNSGADQVIVSFRPGNATDAVYQLEADLAVGTLTYTVLPDWWSLMPTTGCRRTSLLTSLDFSSASGACADPWLGLGFASTTVTPVIPFGDGVVRRLLIHVVAAIPFASALPLDPGTEYYGIRLTINHAKTTSVGSCTGCAEPMCVALVNAYTTANPANPVRLGAWPTGQAAIVWNGGLSCDRLVPAKNRTWGALKSLYR